jgi:hypothetical protein
VVTAFSTATPDTTSCDDFAPTNGNSFQVEAGSFSGTVAKDDAFTFNNPGNRLSVTITGGGTLMQEQELETRCEADEDLTLGTTVEDLQLVDFTDGSGPNTPVVEIVNQYIVFNPQVSARITSASEAYTLNGENGGSSLIAADGEIIASKAQVVYEGNTVQIDLSQSNSFTTTFNMEAPNVAEGGQTCCPYAQSFSFTTQFMWHRQERIRLHNNILLL